MLGILGDRSWPLGYAVDPGGDGGQEMRQQGERRSDC